MASLPEQMAALREKHAQLDEEMRKVQMAMDACVPMFILRGVRRDKPNKTAFPIGVFSTFEKAFTMSGRLNREFLSHLEIHAVPKSETPINRGPGYRPEYLTLDGESDPIGYVSD